MEKSIPESLRDEKTREQGSKDDSNSYLFSGLGLGTLGATSLALTGSVCPLCVVATPILLGTAIYKKMKKTK